MRFKRIAYVVVAWSLACTPVMQVGEADVLARQRPQQWDYWCTIPDRELNAFLNDVGRRGWELILKAPADASELWCFKRPSPTAPDNE